MWNANKLSWKIGLVVLVILLDQSLKYLALQKNLPNWKFFSIIFCNSNLSLGLYLPSYFFWLSWLITFFILLFLINKFKSFYLLLVLAGTLSNLIDRLFFGCVIDYFSFFNFPVFNLADFFISFGFLAFIINSRFYKK